MWFLIIVAWKFVENLLLMIKQFWLPVLIFVVLGFAFPPMWGLILAWAAIKTVTDISKEIDETPVSKE